MKYSSYYCNADKRQLEKVMGIHMPVWLKVIL